MQLPDGGAGGGGVAFCVLVKFKTVDPPAPLPPNPYWASKTGDMLK